MKLIFFITCFATFSAASQEISTWDSVRIDSLRSCPINWVEEKCQVKSICESNNEIEIRLCVFYAPTPQFRLYVLAKKDTNWTAVEYFRSSVAYAQNKIIVVDSSQLTSTAEIITIFSKLQQNNFSSLPDQGSLGLKDYADDGDSYILTFKKGTTFRRYSFNNPELFKENFKHVQEFKEYYNIASAFYNAFPKR